MVGKEQNPKDTDRLEISSDLISAYAISLGKTLLLIVGMIGGYYLALYIIGENPFATILQTIGLPLVWVTRLVVALITILFLAVIFGTLSLTSYELVFEPSGLKYSYGSIIRSNKSTDIANIVRVNYQEYRPLKLGDIIVEFTGTEEKELKVQYVSDAKQKCELINRLVTLKKSEKAEEIKEKGVIS